MSEHRLGIIDRRLDSIEAALNTLLQNQGRIGEVLLTLSRTEAPTLTQAPADPAQAPAETIASPPAKPNGESKPTPAKTAPETPAETKPESTGNTETVGQTQIGPAKAG